MVGKTRRTRAQSWRWREWGEGQRDQAGVLVLGQMATRGLGQGTWGGKVKESSYVSWVGREN